MTDHDNSQGEPTMEEILASIRRIISEDNEDSGTAAQGGAKVESKESREHEGKDRARKEAEVLELSPSQMVAEEKSAAAAGQRPNGFDRSAHDAAPESRAQSSVSASRREEGPKSAHSTQPAGAAETGTEVEETLLSPEVASAAAAAFGALAKDVTVSRRSGNEVRSLEELVKEMMKPMLKEWLDENLPPLVEDVVEREVHRLSHRRVRR